MHMYIGWPGKAYDARVFASSTVYIKGMRGTLFPTWTRKFGSVEFSLVILGDPA